MFNSFPQPKPDSGGTFIKSVQRGLATLTAIAADITLSPIVVANSIARITQKNVGTTGGAANKLLSAELLNETTLRLSIAGAYDVNNQPTASWEVIEFNNVKSKQKGFLAMSASTLPQTVSPVNVNKSLLFTTANTSDNTNDNMISSTHTAQITSSTQLTFATNATVGTLNVYWQLIEFN